MAKKRSPKVNIRIAKEEDIPAILAIQRALLLGNKKGRFIQKRGFLVYPINEEDLKRVTHSNQNVLLVAEGEMGIVGYALAYDLSEWERTKPNWNGNVTTTTPQNNNFGPKTLYFRHIARKPGYKGIGEELEKEVFGIAESKGYNSVLGEILEQPLPNQRSREFHEKRGFTKIGTVTYEDGKIWGLYKKDLRHVTLNNNLERLTATTSIVGVLGGIFFLSANLTGNVISNITNSTSSVIGAGLLIIGLIAGLFYIKKSTNK